MRVAAKATRGAARKGQKWKRGQSSSSNPSIKKHRTKARPTVSSKLSSSDLTVSALNTHNNLNFGNLKLTDDGDQDDAMSDKNSVKTFASVYSHCTNVNFEDFLNKWTADTALEKEMLAVLTSVTETIKEKGGSQSTTEFFACLMTALEDVKDLSVMPATVELLRILASKVSLPVYRHGFSRFMEILIKALTKAKDTKNTNLLRGLIHCLGCVSRSLDGPSWKSLENRPVLEILLMFGQHPDADVRKSVRKVLIGIVTATQSDNSKTAAVLIASLITTQMNEANVKTNNTTSLVCLLSMLRTVIAEVPSQTLKKCSEIVLSFMTLGNIRVSSAGFDVLEAIFVKKNTTGLTAQMSSQIFNALFEFMPNIGESDLVVKWLSTTANLISFWSKNHEDLYANGVIRVAKSFVSFFMSGEQDVHKTVLRCLKTVLDTSLGKELDLEVISQISQAIDSSLELKYSHAWNSALNVVAYKFSVYGQKYSVVCLETLKILVSLRESHQFDQYLELDKTVGVAVQSMGPQTVLQVIHLNLDVNRGRIETAWILPILRQDIITCELSFYLVYFIPMATKIKELSVRLQEADPRTAKHLELIYQQIWSLIPCFLSGATDIASSFGSIAPVLGKTMKQDPSVRSVILSGLRSLCKKVSASTAKKDRETVSKYSKNFLPILLNFYTSEDDMTTKEAQMAVFDTIESFLKICDPSKPIDLYQKTLERYKQTQQTDMFLKIAYLDLMRSYIHFLDEGSLKDVVSSVAEPLFKSKNTRFCKKSYRIVEEICKSPNPNAKKFVGDNLQSILTVILDGIENSPPPVVSAPLNALRHLISQYFVAVPSEMEAMIDRLIPLVFKCLPINSKRIRMSCVEMMKTLTNVATISGTGVPLIKNHLKQFLTHATYGDRALIVITLLFDTLTSTFTDIELMQLLNLIYTPRNSPPIIRAVVEFSKVLLKSRPKDDLLPILPVITGWLNEPKINGKKGCRINFRSLIMKLIRKFGYVFLKLCDLVSDSKIHFFYLLTVLKLCPR